MNLCNGTDPSPYMWLFDTAATVDAGPSFMLTAINGTTPIHEFWLDAIIFHPDMWRDFEEHVVPTKGHLNPPRLQRLPGHQKHRLKNEFSGRRY